ncbi:MAG: TlpA family protein disulfide reductase [Lachnospiraceae bacterium]|nr:TlpA family protein disulfide reductase [Lachnospiraceae bacterium]
MKMIKKMVSVLALLAMVAMAAMLCAGCEGANKNGGEVTATPTAGANNENNTPTPKEDRFPNRPNADTNSGTAKELTAGDVAPEFTLTMLDGKQFRMSDHDDEVVILNFWATWCGPCMNEMPDLMKLAGDKIEGVSICLVSLDFDDAAVSKCVAQNKFNTSIIGCAQNYNLPTYYPSDYIPYTVVIVNGIVRETLVGSRDYNSYKSIVTKALAEK